MKISFNVNVEKLGDRDYFLDVIRQLQPNSITLMGWDRSLIDDVHHVSPTTEVAVRFQGDEEHTEWAYGEDGANNKINAWIAQGWFDCWHHVLNEPTIFVPDDIELGQDLLAGVLDYLIYFMDAACPRGLKLIVGNFGPGTWQALDLDMGLWDEFLRKAGYWSQRGMVRIGFHEYGSPIGPGTDWDPYMFLSPDFAHWWPTPAQLPVARRDGAMPPYYGWHRNFWFDIRAREIGAIPAEKEGTEFGHDRRPDLESAHWPNGTALNVYDEISQRYGHAPLPYLRGQVSYEAYWKAFFPQWTLDEAMFYQYKWYAETTSSLVNGVHLFTWSLDPGWHNFGFNMADRRQFHQLLINYAKSLRDGAPPTEEPPEDDVKYDMARYLGDGRVYRMVNDWGEGDELLQTQRQDNEVFVVKNENWEQLGITKDWIRRGIDTSPVAGQLYIQFENNTAPNIGANWAPRHLTVGQRWKQTPFVRYYDIDVERETGKSYYANDEFLLKAHHSDFTLPSGIKVRNVMELQWIVGGSVEETYWFAEDIGYVMWQGSRGRAWLKEFLPSHPNLTRRPTWLTTNGRTLPKIGDTTPPAPPIEAYPPDDSPEWEHGTIAPLRGGINLRTMPTTNASIILTLESAVAAARGRIDGEWRLVWLKDADRKGWMHVQYFTFVPTNQSPEPRTVRSLTFMATDAEFEFIKQAFNQLGS